MPLGEETLSTESDPYIHAEETLSFILTLREIFSLPRYRETLLHASFEQWTQAREDCLLCCRILRNLAAIFPKRNALITADMRLTWFLTWDNILPPLLLALRTAGYGQWMDETLSGSNALFDHQTKNNDHQDPLPNT